MWYTFVNTSILYILYMTHIQENKYNTGALAQIDLTNAEKIHCNVTNKSEINKSVI